MPTKISKVVQESLYDPFKVARPMKVTRLRGFGRYLDRERRKIHDISVIRRAKDWNHLADKVVGY